MRPLLIQIQLFSLVVFFPMAGFALGFVFFGKIAALWISVTLLVLQIGLLPLVDKAICWIHKTREVTTPGLLHSLNWTARSCEQRVPNLSLISDPAPWALVCRSLFKTKGTILVSQGILNILDEKEQRAFFKETLFRLQDPALILQSYCALLCCLLLKLAPASIVSFFSDQPQSKSLSSTVTPFLGFMIFLPLVSFLMKYGSIFQQKSDFSTKALQKQSSTLFSQETQSLSDALIKIEQSQAVWNKICISPGMKVLLLLNPSHYYPV